MLDSIEGITHAMRSKEYELRDELYYAILDNLEMRKPKLISFSRLAIKGAPISKRLITPLIEEKKVSGYDDPRLPTLSALKRRGISSDAIRKFVLSFGLTKVESEPGWEKLLVENKKIVDANAQRRFFVQRPVKVIVNNLPATVLSMKNHPQNSELGNRDVVAQSPVYISKNDADAFEPGELFRLKDWCNVKFVSKQMQKAIGPNGDEYDIDVINADFESEDGVVRIKCQWVSDSAKIAVSVLKPHDLFIDSKYNENSLEEIWGWAEKNCINDNERDILQFERFGFVTLDKKNDDMQYIFICD